MAMTFVVVISNILVQYQVNLSFGDFRLSDFLTWGAFTYPVAFLVTDLTNRSFGASTARRVVMVGFFVAVILSFYFATPRIAIASGVAFFVAQFSDVFLFDRLRLRVWWVPPFVSTFFGSVIDTILFFGLAFSPAFYFLDFGGESGSLTDLVPLLSVGALVPLWISLAAGDFSAKMLVGLAMLFPYGFFVWFSASPSRST